jgi:hypothetical protein
VVAASIVVAVKVSIPAGVLIVAAFEALAFAGICDFYVGNPK